VKLYRYVSDVHSTNESMGAYYMDSYIVSPNINKNLAKVSYSNLEVSMPIYRYNEFLSQRFTQFGAEAITDGVDPTLRLRNLKTINLTDMGMTNDVFDRVYDISKILIIIRNR
jgi:hypothetical protein